LIDLESSVVPSNEIESRDIGNERDSIGIDESSNIFNALLNESPTNEQSFLENDGPKNDFGDPIIPIQNSSQKQTSNENVIVDIPSQQVGTSTTSVDVSAARNEANVRLSSNRKANLLSRLDNYAG
jgi:hypothetical protein